MDKTATTVATFDKYAREYQEKYGGYGPYIQSYRRFAAYLRPADKVLDIACGPGNISESLLQVHPRLSIRGLDLSAKMLKVARERIPEGLFEQRDIRILDNIEQRFDALVCGFAAPYLSCTELPQLIKDASLLLNRGGYLYLSAQVGDYEKSEYQNNHNGDRVFVYYHSEAFLRATLLENNFAIVDVERSTSPVASMDPTAEIFLYAQHHK